jgi:CARDB
MLILAPSARSLSSTRRTPLPLKVRMSGVRQKICRSSALVFAIGGLLPLLAACEVASLTNIPVRESGGPSLPDYTITVVDSSGEPLDDLSTGVFKVRVQNVGGTDTTGTFIQLYVDGSFVRDTSLRALETLEVDTFTFHWRAQAGAHTISFRVDQPPAGEPWVLESNEQNNSAEIKVSVATRERHLVHQDTIPYAEIPNSIRSAPAVQQVLRVATDSGYVVATGTLAIRSKYDGEGGTAYVAPLEDPDGPADSVPILIVAATPGENADTTVYAIIVHYTDSTSSVVYDAGGAIRVFPANDSIQVLETFNPVGPSSFMAAQQNCSEDWRPPCLGRAGGTIAACMGTALAASLLAPVPLTWLLVFKAAVACGATLLVTSKECFAAFQDDPPTIKVMGVQNGPTCYKCDGNNRIKYTFDGFQAIVTDDRGPAPPIFLTSNVFLPGCKPGAHTFSARDCGGNVTRIVVTTGSSRQLGVEANHPDCRHNQGASGFALMRRLPSRLRDYGSSVCQTTGLG